MVMRSRATSARLKLGVTPLAIVIVALAIFLGTAAAVELHGHRGARGLLPENSIPGFKLAIEAGVDCLEFDVGMTADRKIVIFHNRRLNPDIVRKVIDR